MHTFILSLLLCVNVSVTAPAASQPATTKPAESKPSLRVYFREPGGKDMPRTAIRDLHCRTLGEEPVATRVKVRDGAAEIELPSAAFAVTGRMPVPQRTGETPVPQAVQLSALIPVAGFGEITVYADNAGRGYREPGRVDFIRDAAITRLARVRELLKACEAEGVPIAAELRKKVATAADTLAAIQDSTYQKPVPPTEGGGTIAVARVLTGPSLAKAYESLAASLWAGEELTLARARYRITKLSSPRKDFLFGCNAFGHPARGPLYDQRYRELFNFGMANLYISRYAPTENTRDFARTDAEVAWLHSMGMTAKTCPPVYLARGVTPEWLRNKPWSEAREICRSLMLECGKRYAGKAAFQEIVNEAHDYSNGLRLKPAELDELAAICSQASHEGDPKAARIINSCHLWGEYAARIHSDGPRRSPSQYLRDCIARGVEFEIVGLQLYYPDYDLLEIDRMLERYARFGRPIHITEMGCSSAPGIDPNAQRKKATGGWHGPWTEAIQADWVEGVYTLFYSKPYIKAAAWWDLADAVSFWPYGGLLRGDCSPKPAYTRLLALQRAWGLKVPPVPSPAGEKDRR